MMAAAEDKDAAHIAWYDNNNNNDNDNDDTCKNNVWRNACGWKGFEKARCFWRFIQAFIYILLFSFDIVFFFFFFFFFCCSFLVGVVIFNTASIP